MLGSASEGGVPLIVSITLSRVGLQKRFRAVNCSRHTSFCRHPRFHPGRLESGHVGFLFVSNSKQRRNKRRTPLLSPIFDPIPDFERTYPCNRLFSSYEFFEGVCLYCTVACGVVRGGKGVFRWGGEKSFQSVPCVCLKPLCITPNRMLPRTRTE